MLTWSVGDGTSVYSRCFAGINENRGAGMSGNLEFKLIFSIVQRIDLFVGDEDDIVVAFDVDTDIGESNHSSNSLGEIEAGEMFNDLCQEVHVPLQLPHERVLTFFRGHQTFIAASKAHYESQSILLIYSYNLNANR